MLKILLVSNLYPNEKEPTRGIFTEQIVKGFLKHNQVEVVSPTPWFPKFLSRLQPKKYAPLAKQENFNGVKVYRPSYIVIPKVGRWLYGLLFFFGIFNTLRKVKKDFNPDVINVHWMYPDAFGTVLAARLLNIPVVTHSLGCDINEFSKYPIRKKFIRYALKNADFNITVSEQLREKVIKIGADKDKTITLMNGVNRELFNSEGVNNVRQQFHIADDKTLLLFAGNFNVEKGLSLLLEAYHLQKDKHNQAHLLIIGSGPLENEINHLVEALELTDRVTFVGRVAHTEVAKYLAAVDFLCLPSLREGCPNIVLESLSVGTPVLANNVGALPEMLNPDLGGAGLLTEENTVEGFSIMLDKALSKHWQEIKHFDWITWQDNADQIVDVLNKAQLSSAKQQ